MIEIAAVSVHGSPAAAQTDIAGAKSKRAVPIVVIKTRRVALGRAVSIPHRIDHVVVVRPGELQQIEPAIVVVVEPKRRTAKRELLDSGLGAYVRECSVSIVVIEL